MRDFTPRRSLFKKNARILKTRPGVLESSGSLPRGSSAAAAQQAKRGECRECDGGGFGDCYGSE
jgi:hypothetical protein